MLSEPSTVFSLGAVAVDEAAGRGTALPSEEPLLGSGSAVGRGGGGLQDSRSSARLLTNRPTWELSWKSYGRGRHMHMVTAIEHQPKGGHGER